ncbi:MAG: polyprenyl synthetase family protein [Ktedonobacteraceae bacterium]|nr:polyprenyl synthetase family protein [Ktedonobacteraceae bacterium]
MVDPTPCLTETSTLYQRHLYEKLEKLLTEVPPSLRVDVERSLKEQGKLLYVPQTTNVGTVNEPVSGIWSLLTLLVAQQVNPLVDLKEATTVAVAVECLICALDLLDDVEDEDQTAVLAELGPARALNASTALFALAQRAMLSVTPPDLSLLLLDAVQEDLLVATAAQHRDLLAEQRPATSMTREECIEIAVGKAGALMHLACRLGATCAGASPEVIEQFARFGSLYGIFQQLDNDCHDLYYLLQDESQSLKGGEAARTKRSGKSDLARGKKTLPVVLAAQRHAAHEKATGEEQSIAIAAYQQSLRDGVIAAWGICLLYRERAKDALQEIEAQLSATSALRQLLRLD